jgi:hypothetical protein
LYLNPRNPAELGLAKFPALSIKKKKKKEREKEKKEKQNRKAVK